MLTLPDLQQPFEIETEASDYAIGAVLTQQGNLVAYHSETLFDIVCKYPTYDKEMYSIVHDCRQWKHYILGKETIIHGSTNHNLFQVGLRFQPLCPIDIAMPFAATRLDSAHVQYDVSKVNNFIERIQHIHQ